MSIILFSENKRTKLLEHRKQFCKQGMKERILDYFFLIYYKGEGFFLITSERHETRGIFETASESRVNNGIYFLHCILNIIRNSVLLL